MRIHDTSFFAVIIFTLWNCFIICGYAQCNIEHSYSNFETSVQINSSPEMKTYGQSFTTTCGGRIRYFEILESTLIENSTATLKIYAEEDLDADPIFSQSYSLTPNWLNLPIRFLIEEDVVLLSDNLYTVTVTFNNTELILSSVNGYNEGMGYFNENFQPNTDLFFRLSISNIDNCNVGNEYVIPNSTYTSTFPVLIAHPFTLENSGTLTGLGITGINYANIRMAFYDDLNGAPHNLLAETGIVQPIGMQVFQVNQINLDAGNYWIAINSGSPNVPFMLVESTDTILYGTCYSFINFQTELPQVFSGAMSTSMSILPIFAEITCSILETENIHFKPITLSPNPTTDKLRIFGNDENMSYKIYSLSGMQILSGDVNLDSVIDVSSLPTGLYMLSFSNASSIKFIKN